MQIKPFATEEFFARYEFSAPFMLSASDCESMTIEELLALHGEVTLEDLGSCPLHYTESQGGLLVRETIARSYGEHTVDPEHVIMLNAPQEGIYLAMSALLEPSDSVLVLTPCYDSLLQVAEQVGCEIHRFELEHTLDTPTRWHVDLEKLEQALATHTPRMLIVNFPHNPTGYLPTPSQWRAIQTLATNHGALLFSDEMYRGLERIPGSQLLSPCQSEEEAFKTRGITLAGLSKSHGLPGLRSGWLVVPDDSSRQRILAWKHYTSICAPAPVEWLTCVALEVQQKLFARSRALIAANTGHVEEFLSRHTEHFSWIPPDAGSVALLETPWEDVEEKAHWFGRELGVVVLPGKFLGAGARTIRLGLGRQGFKEALQAFEEGLEQ